MDNEIIRICVVDTPYTLFLYFLKFGFNTEEDIFIFSEGIPKEIRNKINHIFYPHFIFPYDLNSSVFSKIKQFFINSFRQAYNIIKLRIILFFKTRNKNVEVYGHAHLNYSFPLYEYENSNLIEDGLVNYGTLEYPHNFHPLFRRFINFFGFYTKGFYECFGTHDNIKKVYLTKKECPMIIRDKCEYMDMNSLWAEKSSYEKNQILKFFNLDGLNEFLGLTAIFLITGPLSEGGLLSLDEEIKIYEDLIKNYDDEVIIIKPHPRERKNYREIFPDKIVIESYFPFELIKFLDIGVKKILTINSSVALNFVGECDIEIYDKETSSKVLNESILDLKNQLNKIID